MKSLAQWLQNELRARGLTQAAASTHAGVSPATMSQILAQDHIPTMEILFRLADYFGTPRENVLRIAARIPLPGDEPADEDEAIIMELLEEFRQIPDEWKETAINQVAELRRAAERPSARIIGEELETERNAETPQT